MRATGESRRTFRGGVLALFLLSVGAPVAAAPVTWEMTGTVNTTSGGLAGELAALFPTGSLASFTLSYDTDAVDTYAWTSSRGTYEYFAPGASTGLIFDADIAGHQYGMSGAGRPMLNVFPDLGSLIVDTSLSGRAVAGASVGARSWRPEALDLGLFWGSALPSDALPSSVPAGGNGAFTLYLQTTGGRAQVSGAISSVHSVPEPGSLALVGLGLAGLAAFRRRHS